MLFNMSAGDNTSEEVQVILSSFMDEMAGVVNTLKTDVSSQLATFKSDVNSKITTLTSAVNSKATVKSVQRGVATGSGESNIVISINSVNPNKCEVILNATKVFDGLDSYSPSLVSITATSLTVTPHGYKNSSGFSNFPFSWQVIEFY